MFVFILPNSSGAFIHSIVNNHVLHITAIFNFAPTISLQPVNTEYTVYKIFTISWIRI
jgi:hypothetical protein